MARSRSRPRVRFAPPRRAGLLSPAMERAMHVMEAVIGCLALAALPACGPSAPDLDDVHRDQRELLFRLGRLDRSVEGAAPQPAAAPAAPVVKTYPDEAYAALGRASPVRGPHSAAASIVACCDL